MDIDDQLAALAAGELEPQEARALRARVAADPALARRLHRIQTVDGLLAGWDAPPMPAEAAARLDDRILGALAELGDGPLATAEEEPEAEVIDLAAARARRGLPPWLGGLAVAAALTAVVGTGTLVGLGDSDGPTADILADGGTDSAADDAADGAAESAPMDAEPMAPGEEMDALPAAPDLDAPLTGPVLASGLVLDEEALADVARRDEVIAAVAAPPTDREATIDVQLHSSEVTSGGEHASQGDADGSPEEGAPQPEPRTFDRLELCLDAAREATPGGYAALVGTGTYEGEPAIVVVLVLADEADETGTPVIVRVYDPATCIELATRESRV